MLYDSTVHEGTVGHRHVEHIHYASVPNREIASGSDEASADMWGWDTAIELQAVTVSRPSFSSASNQ